jgi:hypothetical protein
MSNEQQSPDTGSAPADHIDVNHPLWQRQHRRNLLIRLEAKEREQRRQEAQTKRKGSKP